MPEKTSKKTEADEHDIEGHLVRIVSDSEREELWIDGVRRRFFKNSGGYVLFDSAYVPARELLVDAVRDYLSHAERPKPVKRSGGR
jgi:hypothetical protein